MKIVRDGVPMTLGAKAPHQASGKNPPCCDKARTIVEGAEFCVCVCRSYCPHHGLRHVGSHS